VALGIHNGNKLKTKDKSKKIKVKAKVDELSYEIH